MNIPFFNKHTHVSNASYTRFFKEIGRNTYVDWILIIVLSFIVAVILALGSVSLYSSVTKGNIKGANVKVAESPDIFSTTDLSNLIRTFDQKAAKTTEAEKGYVGGADPSQ